jgi:type IX secretion system PorP/SprF family membrane protein
MTKLVSTKVFPFLLAWLLLFVLSPCSAQLRPQYSQYVLNNYLLNPAIAGIEDYTDIRLSTRQQWVGIDGAPATYYLTLHAPLGQGQPTANSDASEKPHAFAASGLRSAYKRAKAHHGIGLMALHDQAGIQQSSELSLSYAWHQPLHRHLKLAAGFQAGIHQIALRGSQLLLNTNPDNAAIDQYGLRPQLGAGLWLYSSSFYMGASFVQWLAGGLPDPVAGSAQRHYFLTAGYRVRLSERWDVVPAVLHRWTAPLPSGTDVNVRFIYASRIWAGAAWRFQESAIFMAGASLNQWLDLGYSYDLGQRSGISRASAGSHEIVLGFRLNNRFRVYCPQNLW